MSQPHAAALERNILENVNDVIYAVDGDVFSGQVKFVNGQAERLLGYRPQDFVDDPTLWIRNVHPDDLPRLMETTRTMIESGQPATRVFRVRHRDGQRFVWFEDRVVPKLGDDGRVVGILGIARDITARREAEIELERSFQSLQRLDGLGRFAGGIAHDLGNVFTVLIAGFGRLDDKTGKGFGSDATYESVKDAARRGHELTKSLLGFVRRKPAGAVRVDLGALVTEMGVLFARIVGQGVEIITRLGPRRVCVRGEPSQIEQVLMNLVVNARDATREGGRITIATDLSHDPQSGAWVLLRVSDTGCGMDAETRKRIFEPLFTTKPEGSGLGLATVNRIVLEMGGRISVESEPGRGSTFEVWLPADEDDGSRHDAAKSSTAAK